MICNMCPRKCGVDRDFSRGVCMSKEEITVSRTMRHFWEEPCISGKKGSGAIFFSGCNLKCIYCQNCDISRGKNGKTLSNEEFEHLLVNISESSVDNINLVTPTHFSKQIAECIEKVKNKLSVPIVWNTSGYESVEGINELSGKVDVFLTDLKYKSMTLSEEYSRASDYFAIATAALEKMLDITDSPVFNEFGIMTQGVIVRHMVLPGAREDSKEILRVLEKYRDKIILSLMCQYTPTPSVKMHPKLRRRTTSLEYNDVVEMARQIGFKGYIQERASATPGYTPDFSDVWEFTP